MAINEDSITAYDNNLIVTSNAPEVNYTLFYDIKILNDCQRFSKIKARKVRNTPNKLVAKIGKQMFCKKQILY